jgi:UDP-3-O-[3-hydroxymyristoyl] glucosamine N-acyltransferase
MEVSDSGNVKYFSAGLELNNTLANFVSNSNGVFVNNAYFRISNGTTNLLVVDESFDTSGETSVIGINKEKVFIKNLTVLEDITVDKNLMVKNNFTVEKNAIVENDLSVIGNVAFGGNLTVQESTFINNSLNVENNTIIKKILTVEDSLVIKNSSRNFVIIGVNSNNVSTNDFILSVNENEVSINNSTFIVKDVNSNSETVYFAGGSNGTNSIFVSNSSGIFINNASFRIKNGTTNVFVADKLFNQSIESSVVGISENEVFVKDLIVLENITLNNNLSVLRNAIIGNNLTVEQDVFIGKDLLVENTLVIKNSSKNIGIINANSGNIFSDDFVLNINEQGVNVNNNSFTVKDLGSGSNIFYLTVGSDVKEGNFISNSSGIFINNSSFNINYENNSRMFVDGDIISLVDNAVVIKNNKTFVKELEIDGNLVVKGKFIYIFYFKQFVSLFLFYIRTKFGGGNYFPSFLSGNIEISSIDTYCNKIIGKIDEAFDYFLDLLIIDATAVTKVGYLIRSGSNIFGFLYSYYYIFF